MVRALTSEFVVWTGRCCLYPLGVDTKRAISSQHCLVLGLAPDCGLPMHCMGLGTTLTLVTEAPTVWYMLSFALSHVFWPPSVANQWIRISRGLTIGTRYICHEGGMGTWTGSPAFLCRTLPPVELRTHISFTGVPFYGHPCSLPASPDASDAFWRDSTIPTQRSRVQLLSIAALVAWPSVHGETAAHHGIPSLRFPRTPLPLTSLLPWKTLPEMMMLSTTLGTLTSVSDGKGHTGQVLQHSHAGGSEWLFLYSKNIHKGFSYFSWPALGLDSTYVYIY